MSTEKHLTKLTQLKYLQTQGQQKINQYSIYCRTQCTLKDRSIESITKQKMGKKQNLLYSFEYFEGQIEEYIGDNTSGEWHRVQARICNNSFILPLRLIKINNLTKIKCLSEESFENSRQIKFTNNSNESIFISASITNKIVDIPFHYIWFAKLINLKLLSLGKRQIPQNDKKNECQQNAKIRGIIYKRSQFFGQWNERIVEINEKGLYSFKPKQEKHSFFISTKDLAYIWTRFDFYKDCLIIKLKYGVCLEQTQFAIPIMNYCEKNNQNWLYWLYNLMMQKYHATAKSTI